MRRYRHLSAEERDRIAEMHARHEGVSAIAAAIGRNKSTVSREIARNGRNGRYGAIAAQSRSDARRKACRPRKRLSDPALAAEVRRRIVDDRRSPGQIDGRSRLERGGRCVVSFSTIYRAVNAGEPDPPQAAPEEGVRGRLRRRGRRPRRGREETRGRIKVDHEVSGPRARPTRARGSATGRATPWSARPRHARSPWPAGRRACSWAAGPGRIARPRSRRWRSGRSRAGRLRP